MYLLMSQIHRDVSARMYLKTPGNLDWIGKVLTRLIEAFDAKSREVVAPLCALPSTLKQRVRLERARLAPLIIVDILSARVKSAMLQRFLASRPRSHVIALRQRDRDP